MSKSNKAPQNRKPFARALPLFAANELSNCAAWATREAAQAALDSLLGANPNFGWIEIVYSAEYSKPGGSWLLYRHYDKPIQWCGEYITYGSFITKRCISGHVQRYDRPNARGGAENFSYADA